MQVILSTPSINETNWSELLPVIDPALHELGDRDREALLLRYFEGYSFAEVGLAVGVSENTARMKVARALEKLRVRLARRGITSTAAVLGTALSAQPAVVVPAAVATSVAETSVTAWLSGAAPAGSFAAFAPAKLGTVIGVAALATAVWQVNEASQIGRRFSMEETRQNFFLAQERTENLRLRAEARKKIETPPRADVDSYARLRAVTQLVGSGAFGNLKWRPLGRWQDYDVSAVAELFALKADETRILQQAIDQAKREIVAAALAGAHTQRNGNSVVIEIHASAAATESYDRLLAKLQQVLGEERFRYFDQIGCAGILKGAFDNLGLATTTLILSRLENPRRADAPYELAETRESPDGARGGGGGTASRDAMLVNLGPLSGLVPADL